MTCDHVKCSLEARHTLRAPKTTVLGEPPTTELSNWTARSCDQHLEQYLAAGWVKT